MKKFFSNWTPWIVIGIMILVLIPSVAKRVSVENSNKNVVVAVNLNDIETRVSDGKFFSFFEDIKELGVKKVTLMEENVNSLVVMGHVSSIKYNVLCHRYDEESVRIANVIKQKCPRVAYDSHVVLVRKPEYKEKFEKMISLKHTKKEYASIKNVENMDIYILYDGRKQLWDYSLGYDTDKLDFIRESGFDIVLTHKLNSYRSTEYLAEMENIIREYDVKFLNLKKAKIDKNFEDYNPRNYGAIADLINKYDMTLVVTENTDQLGNDKFYGYQYVFNKVMGEDGSKKIMRSYETNDDSQSKDDTTHFMYRTAQFYNSTIDRNLKFITVTQIAPEDIPFEDCADYTLDAAELYISKIKALGYNLDSDPQPIDYTTNKKLNGAACAVIMLMALLIMWQILSGKKDTRLLVIALILAAFAFLASFVMPKVLLSLYPTVYSALQSCFVMTLVMWFVREYAPKLSMPIALIGAAVLMIGALLIGSIGLGAMLSGIEYYVNNEYFRGIKISLLAPVAYTAIVFYFLFMKNNERTIGEDIKKALYSDIKVYWVIVALFVGVIGGYYIIRSGNVSSISALELALRNTIMEIFPARPRTKEFLVGYPALVLFVYYMKNSNITLFKWGFAVGASILAASVTNSFCHVFTDYTTICMRVLNGFIVGFFVSVAAYIANALIIKLVKKISEKI